MKFPFTIYDLRFTIWRKSAESAVFNRQSSIVNRKFNRAFTLVEMLVVISILGILAGLTVPALKSLGKSDAAVTASRQMLEGVGRARQLAIANHATVYMIFVTTNFWNNLTGLTPAQLTVANNLCDKQLSGYTYVAYGGAGDQPGQHAWHYLEPWQSLPDGTFVASWKFMPPGPAPAAVVAGINVYGFGTNAIPFPTVDSPLAVVPCVAFNYLGQLTFDGQNPSGRDEYIPLARGSVYAAKDQATKVLQFSPADVSEMPPGNSTSSAYSIVDIDWLTGRATLRFQKVQ